MVKKKQFRANTVEVQNNCCGLLIVSLVCLGMCSYLSFLFTGDNDVKYVLLKHAVNHSTAHMEHKAKNHDDDDIDPDEFHNMLCEHGAEQFDDEAIQAADKDGNGRLTKAELAKAMSHAAKLHGTYLQRKYVAESKKRMCQIGAYQPVWLDAQGEGWFEAVAAVINFAQGLMWFVTSAGYLVICPVHTLFGFILCGVVSVLLVCLGLICTATWRFVRWMMGRPTPICGDITVATCSATVSGIIGFILIIQVMHLVRAWLIPEEYFAFYSKGGNGSTVEL